MGSVWRGVLPSRSDVLNQSLAESKQGDLREVELDY